MPSPRWRKVLRDLWSNKTRTLLVVLSIAVGVFAVGSIAHMNVIVSHDLDESYRAVEPADAILYTGQSFDDELVQSIRRVDGVRAAEGRRQFAARFKSPYDDKWYPLLLFVVPDYAGMQINKVERESTYSPDPEKWRGGAWPPPDRALVLERTSLILPTMGLGGAKLGDTLLVEMPSGKQRTLPLAGLAYDFGNYPATFSGMAIAYITMDTLEWFGEPRTLNELDILVAGDLRYPEGIKSVGDEVRDKIEKSGNSVLRIEQRQPGQMPLYYIFNAITFLLGFLGALSLFLSVLLVVNTVSAQVGQQTRQIGVMKAIGARGDQIAAMYLATVAIYGTLAILAAIPFGIYAAEWFVNFMAYFMNFELKSFRIPPEVLAFEVAVGLGVPLVAALLPILRAAQLTVREALADYGISHSHRRVPGFKFSLGPSGSEGKLETWNLLPRPLLLSLRNTFRRKARMTLTLLTLILAGTIFIGNMNVRASLARTLETALQYLQSDVWINLKQDYPRERVELTAQQTPGVVLAQGWEGSNAYRVRPDGTASAGFSIQAPLESSTLIQPIVVAGRWLVPQDDNAMVISTSLLQAEPGIDVGDEIVVKIGGRKTDWKVVGIVRTPFMSPLAYANYTYFSRVAHAAGDANLLMAVTEKHDAESQTLTGEALSQHLTDSGIQVSYTQTTSQVRARVGALFDVIFIFLMAMTFLMATVGGLGLMGTMSLNVLERTREIGMMRAIGASNGAVQQIVIVEGILIGVISWAAGAVLALPLGQGLGNALGIVMLQTPLDQVYSTEGALLWLVLVVVISTLASYWPARNAARLTVRQVLAYE